MLQVQTGTWVDKIGGGHCLRIIDMDRPGELQALIVFINKVTRAVCGTQTAGGTFLGDDIPRPDVELNIESARFAVQGKKIGVGKNFNIWRPTGLYQLWRQDSERTVIGRESLVQLGHYPADRSRFFHQVDVIPQFGQIQGRLHTGYPPSDDHYRAFSIFLFLCHKIFLSFLSSAEN